MQRPLAAPCSLHTGCELACEVFRQERAGSREPREEGALGEAASTCCRVALQEEGWERLACAGSGSPKGSFRDLSTVWMEQREREWDQAGLPSSADGVHQRQAVRGKAGGATGPVLPKAFRGETSSVFSASGTGPVEHERLNIEEGRGAQGEVSPAVRRSRVGRKERTWIWRRTLAQDSGMQ